jgi:hypothetical protein
VRSEGGRSEQKKMDQEFEEFFQYLEEKISMTTTTGSSEGEIKNILKPLKYLMWKQQLKKGAKIALLFASICFTVYHVDSLNWLFCGVGRLLMIKILPLWNWRYLGKAKCLIEKAQVPAYDDDNKFNNDADELSSRDCRVCENFGRLFNFPLM